MSIARRIAMTAACVALLSSISATGVAQDSAGKRKPFVVVSGLKIEDIEQDIAPAGIPDVGPQDPAAAQPAYQDLFRPIQDISLQIRFVDKEVPESRAAVLAQLPRPEWSELNPAAQVFCWEAPNICFQPLYFEDIGLERYGETCSPSRQVLKSATHFGKSFLTLPYHLMIDPSWNCDSPYGYCRPGDLAPCVQQRFFYRW